MAEKLTSAAWKDAATHREPKWPLRGYAPGNYTGVCRVCEQRFDNMDKRAWHCLPCAIEEAEFLISSRAALRSGPE